MKLKHGRIFLWSTVALFVLVRLLQYIFVIDADGFFVRETLGQQILSDLLYWLMGAAVLYGFALRINRQNRDVSLPTPFYTKGTMGWSIVVAVMLTAYAIGELMVKNWIGIFALLAAVYFVLLAIRCTGKDVKIMSFTAIFALAYPCAAAIRMFFDTFREIKASENIVDMVARCAMILMMVVLTKLFMNFEEKIGRVAWGFWLYAVFGCLSGICKLVPLFTGDFAWRTLLLIGSDIALWAMAIYLYHLCPSAQQYARDLSSPVEETEITQ